MWGWCMVSTFNLLLGLVLAEICSAYPTVSAGRELQCSPNSKEELQALGTVSDQLCANSWAEACS